MDHVHSQSSEQWLKKLGLLSLYREDVGEEMGGEAMVTFVKYLKTCLLKERLIFVLYFCSIK